MKRAPSLGLSLAPGFSRVLADDVEGNRFNGFPAGAADKPLKRFVPLDDVHTRLKPGANERPEAMTTRRGMNTLETKLRLAAAQKVIVNHVAITVELADGRTITAPLNWYPRLQYATAAERKNWRLVGRGEGVHWPVLDEDISVENILAGKPSGESQQSFKRWLESRAKKK